MTRLKEDDIAGLGRRLELHDRQLRQQTGRGLAEIAALAAGYRGNLQYRLKKVLVGIVPLTTGEGIIGGFSETVEAILSYIGMKCFVTSMPDAAGMVEAVERGAGQIFMADDLTCSMLDLQAHCSADNGVCTGRGFAAALEARAGSVRGRTVTVLGAGPVGTSAAEYFVSRGADVVIYDKMPEKCSQFVEKPHFKVAGSLGEALAASSLYFEATTARDTINLQDMSADTLVAAPGIPLGVSSDAMERFGSQVIHDPLELGVASMAFELQVKAALKGFDETRKIS